MNGLSFAEQARPRQRSFYPLVGISIAVHVLALVIIPLTTSLFHKDVEYIRPKTFQIVQPPEPKAPAPPTPKAKPKPKPVQKTQEPVPAKEKKTVERTEEKPEPAEEDLSDLEDILEAIPAPARVTSLTPDFKYPWYLMNVQQKAERHWKPPEGNRDTKVVVAFTIFRNGSISNVKLTESSGRSLLDKLAVRAVRLAAPFGKLPPGFSGDQLDLQCAFRPVRK